MISDLCDLRDLAVKKYLGSWSPFFFGAALHSRWQPCHAAGLAEVDPADVDAGKSFYGQRLLNQGVPRPSSTRGLQASGHPPNRYVVAALHARDRRPG